MRKQVSKTLWPVKITYANKSNETAVLWRALEMDIHYVVGLSGANNIYINANMAANGKGKFSLKNNYLVTLGKIFQQAT